MKHQRIIITFVSSVILLVALIMVMSNQMKDDDSVKQKETNEEQTINSPVSMLSNQESIEEIHIQYKDDEIILDKALNGLWSGKDLDRKSDVEKVHQAVNIILNLGGETIDEKVEEGIGNPYVSIEVRYKSEEAKVITISSLSEDADHYYATVTGNDAVYQIESTYIEQIPVTKHAIENNSIITITSNQINNLTIYNGIQTIELKPESPYAPEEVLTNLSGWFMHQPYNRVYNVKYNSIESMIYGLEELEFEQIIEENAADLLPYGLNGVDFTISLSSDEHSEELLIGDPAGDNNYYVMLEGESTIYTINKKALEPYSYQAFDMVEHFVKILTLNTIKKINISDDKDTFSIDIEGKSTDSTPKFLLDGQQVEDQVFRDLYKTIAGLSINEEVEGEVVYNTPETTLEYVITTGTTEEKTILVEFVPYDDEKYVVFINNTADFLINKENVSNMKEEIRVVKEDIS